MKARDSSQSLSLSFQPAIGRNVRCAQTLSTGRLHEDVSIASLDKRWPSVAIPRKDRINFIASYLLAALEASESGTLLAAIEDW